VAGQDDLYKHASTQYGPALRRLVRGYEADLERRRDLLQDIHIELWRSLRLFDGRCSLQTWVYRVAHNVAASHVGRSLRLTERLVELDALESEHVFVDGEAQAGERDVLARLLERIHSLKPLDRQIILLYLEGETAAAIAEVAGISPANVATKIHRLKKMLGREHTQGVPHERK
jgi:RNA polymerase sigma-70 factor (ECF subfamily)